jgi:hypothetical protein
MVGAAILLISIQSRAADPATGPDLSTPRKAALTFARALDAGDMGMLRQSATGMVEQFAALRQASDTYAAVNRYEAAAVKKFGPAGKLPFPFGLTAKVEGAAEKIDGNKATLFIKTEPRGNDLVKLVREDNTWRVDLSSIRPLGYSLDIWFARNCRYTSGGYIEIRARSETPLILKAGNAAGMNVAELEIEKATQIKLLLHKRRISQLLESDAAVRETQWFTQFVSLRHGKEPVDVPAAKADLFARLAVIPETGTRLISVQFSFSNSKDCQTMVTEIVNERIKEFKTTEDSNDLTQSAALQSLKLNYESQIHDANRLKQTIAAELGGMGIRVSPGPSSKDFELQQLLSEELKARALCGAAVAKLETFKKQLETNSAPELDEALEKSARLNDYRRQAEELERNWVAMLANVGAQDPKVLDLKRRLDEAQNRSLNAIEEIKARTVTLVLANLKNDVNAARSAIDRIGNRIREVRQEKAAVATKQNEYGLLENLAAELHAKIERIRDQQDKLAAAANGSKSPLIAWAALPDLPDTPEAAKQGDSTADFVNGVSNTVQAGGYDTAEQAFAALEHWLAVAMKPASSR